MYVGVVDGEFFFVSVRKGRVRGCDCRCFDTVSDFGASVKKFYWENYCV